MKETFFRTMTWLHTWTGLLASWLLLLVFFAGTLSYYRYEISLWMKPELHTNVMQTYAQVPLAQTLEQGQDYLAQVAPDARSWMLRLPTHRVPYVSFSWQDKPLEGQRRGKFHEHIVATDGSMITEVRETKGGHFFYRLHFDLHYLPVALARYLVGLATMAMLLAIISGIVIHKRIFKDFFALRLKKGTRSWLDGHTLSSVVALPYHLMITYTGLIALMFMYMPSVLQATYEGDRRALRADLMPEIAQMTSTAEYTELVSVSGLLPHIEQQTQGQPIRDIRIQSPMQAGSQIQVTLRNDNRVSDSEPRLFFDGVTGAFLGRSDGAVSSVSEAYETMIGLHAGRFATPMLRFALFISGVLGFVMVATGSLLWSKKLRQKQQKQLETGAKPSKGLFITDNLNLGVIAGLPIAGACYLWANRLIPASYSARYDAEIHLFFIGLAATLILAFVGRLRWRSASLVGAALWLGVPLINGVTSSQNLISNIASGQWFIAWVDVMALMIGAALLVVARYSKRADSKADVAMAEERS